MEEAQVVLKDREVIDQLLDDQMNHVSPVKRVYGMIAGRRRCSAPVAVTAVSAREEQTCSQSQKRVQAEI